MEAKDEPTWTEAGLKGIAPTGRREVFPDPTVPGLVLLMTPNGVKTFYLVYRFPRGRAGKKRWFKLGILKTDIGLKTARDRATIIRGEIQAGSDPQGDRMRKAPKEPTVDELCDRFTTEYIKAGKVKASTGAFYRRYIDANIKPAIGTMKVREVTGNHVATLLASVKPGSAGKLKSTLSRLFTRAHLWHMRPGLDNPVIGQEGGQTNHREVRLTDDQIRQIGLKFAGWGGPWQIPAMVRLLLLTGMRVGELVGSKAGKIQQRPWATVDLEAGVMVLAPEDHKTGRKTGEKTIYLCVEAVAILKELPRENGEVLGGWMNPQDAYSDLRKALPILKGTTLHDLRHTFISTGDSLGISPATVSALVGHAAKTQTGRYTHKFNAELAEAAQKIGKHLAGLLAR